jgi:hypothetical protein
LVLVPVRFGGTEDRHAVVRDWDLWGPLLFSLMLSVSLATGSDDPSKVGREEEDLTSKFHLEMKISKKKKKNLR